MGRTGTPPIRVVVADDNPVIRMGLVSLLEFADDIDLVAEAGSGPEALALVERHAPEVLLLDVRMPRGGGLDVVAAASELTRVMMLTYSDEPEIVAAALEGGATGYLIHGAFDTHELAQAIRDTAAGAPRLSPAAAAVLMQRSRGPAVSAPAAAELAQAGPVAQSDPSERVVDAAQRFGLSVRERELCQLLVEGCSNSEIAGQLFIEPKTVKNHLNRIFAKLGVRSRGEASAVLLGLREEA